MWNLVKISFIEPFDKRKKMEFRISWLTDQLTSLVGPFKDFEYTMCYYIYDVQKHNNIVSYTCPHGERPTAFILSIVPLFLRAAQCLKQAYDDGYYKGNPIIINFFKYFSSILASILSYLVKLSKDGSANDEADKSLLVSWIIMAAITTLYSYSWDLKKDWGFLEPGQKGLRKHLMYEKKRYYYIAMVNNLILRCVWVFSISPDIIGIFGVPSHTFNFFVYFFEAIRRCQWNFFRVEKEHIVNYLKYRAVLDLHLVPVAKSMTENLSQSQNSKQSHEFQQLDSEENYSIDKRNIDVNLSEGTYFQIFIDIYYNIQKFLLIKDKILNQLENDNLKQIQENNFQYYRLIQKEQNEGLQTSQLLHSLKQFKKNIYKQGQTYYQIYDKDKEKQD
ncbi:hypothetical protein PPERSA_09804 [Pseudocohnilembus persalinus]|uniref:EXS domain-containing protein n=1 Tax=Pseudocohnilembus persalinus TaxID=266149 RepID=A0A0V0QUL5_PSEPJ|nr:hypothetical protein PPERSA_09804 [Pseudocohnilembus persalinus]|eukprot:KRX05664.1 hypothetical protein PPERSA_09804 [Pseudocohnilembus persalinus]